MNVIAIILMVFGGAIIAANAWLPIRYFVLRRQDRSISSIPIIGGLAAALGMVMSSSPTLRSFAWVPLLVDVGGLPSVALLVLYKVHEACASSSSYPVRPSRSGLP